MQRTIQKPVQISGTGLHTGCRVSMRLEPAPAGTGVIFRRTDLQGFEIEALRRHVSRVVLATTLMKKGVMLSTVEHLLSAVYGLEIDNLFIEIDSLEVPILDGSAQPFVDLIEQAGIRSLDRDRTFLKVKRPTCLRNGDKFISIEPSNTFRISYEIDFEHRSIGHQKLELEITPENYIREIAFARTFGFQSEVEDLLRKGLIRGGSLENAVVLHDTGIMNGPLRAEHEFVRHKILDLIGDISLCGFPVIGHISAHKAGHGLHTDLATALSRHSDLFEKVTESELLSRAANF